MTEEPNLLLDKARTAFRAGRLKETEALLQQAVARQPGLAAAHEIGRAHV